MRPDPLMACVALAVVLALVALALVASARRHEGFEPAPPFDPEQTAVLRHVAPEAGTGGSADDFRALQEFVFRDALPHGLFVPGATAAALQEADLGGALTTPDPLEPAAGGPAPRRYKPFFVPEPLEAVLKVDAACRSARHPANLSRAAAEQAGCGWVYDEAGASFGAYGTRSGPFNAGATTGGGASGKRWLWDLAEAARLENVKVCKQARSCNAALVANTASASAAPCGFCAPRGWGVPVTAAAGATKLLYAGTCEAEPLTAPAQCEAVAAQRHATATAQAEVNGTPPPPPPGAGPCDGGSGTAFLPAPCVAQLALDAGLKEEGALLRLLRAGGKREPDDVTAGAMRIVARALNLTGGVLPRALYAPAAARPTIDSLKTQDDLRALLVHLLSLGSTAGTAAAAAHLTMDAARRDFDLCAPYEDATPTALVPLVCAQRAFRLAGCQPAGEAYPRTAAQRDAVGTFGGLQRAYKVLAEGLRTAAPGGDNTLALRQCLGVAVPAAPSPPAPCNELGVEYLLYAMPTSGAPAGVPAGFGEAVPLQLLARHVTRGGFVNISTSAALLNSGRAENVFVRARAILRTGGAALSGAGGVSTDDGVRVRLANEDGTGAATLVESWKNQGTARYAYSLSVPANAARRVQVDWYQGGGWSTLVVDGALNAPSLLYLARRRVDPFVELAFPRGAFQGDLVGAVQMAVAGPLALTAAPPGGATAHFAKLAGGTSVSVPNAVRLGAFGALTARVRLPSSSSSAAAAAAQYLLYFRNTAVFGGVRSAWEVGWRKGRVFCAARSNGQAYAVEAPLPAPNTWAHLAVVWRAGHRGMDLFVNGVLAGSLTCPPMADAVLATNALLTGVVGDVAYVRLFDLPLTAAQLREEAAAA